MFPHQLHVLEFCVNLRILYQNKHGSVSSSHFLTKTTFLTFLTKPPFYNLVQNNTTYQSAHKIQEMTPGGKQLYSITDIQEIFRDNQQTIHVVKTIELSQTQLKLRKIGVESRQILIFTSD
ncbi:hypothetical protein Glove_36g14 [Diversispora epigaea]|uniref:Uncharacterized protein n=1 Tax=Diversispora epigaea TaxID=1348612 RepID=A0A397JJD9_9GLOM|nr:hypothetical protein Glove_36g14 [Diversispora epigaea]